MIYTRVVPGVLFLVLITLSGGCRKAPPATRPAAVVPTTAMPTTTAEHVPYFAWMSADIARGGQPKSEEAFRELKDAGIITVISVDGAKPDLELVKK